MDMDVVIFYCKECRRETVHDVVNYSDESNDSWYEITIQCSECGKEHVMKVYC